MRRSLRSTCKWSGAVLTGLLVAMWIASVWWGCGGGLTPSLGGGIGSGRINVMWTEPFKITPLQLRTRGPARHSPMHYWTFHGWWRRSRSDGLRDTAIYIPIWTVVLLTAVPTAWIWRRDQPLAPGRCEKCGYDLRGAAHAACPECGTVIAAPSPSS
ncbi:MAG: hypothetical protein KJZ69_03795 [Phycisphaerales bacterium]|nr:hypothetical protein [Phycisphaerales bacterium]